MTVKKWVVRDRINLVRLKQWLKLESVLQQLKHARKLPGNVELDDEIQPSIASRTSVALGASMLPVNELVTHEPSHLEPFLPTVPRPPPPVKPDLPSVQRLAPPSYVASGLLTTEDAEASAAAAAADVDLLLGSADESTTFLPSRIERTRHCTAGGAGGAASRQLRRNMEHFSGTPAADEGVLRAAQERMGANLDVLKRERVRLRDHRGKALGTTCLAISSIVVIAIAFLIMFF
ncbi:hypothetical protein EDB85DRAFT_2146368 [Lactarius pseudohatsudake]|nr:hypothetical protein EDB85DRAFT_2146368 [Lactarius pseudohatsudake]